MREICIIGEPMPPVSGSPIMKENMCKKYIDKISGQGRCGGYGEIYRLMEEFLENFFCGMGESRRGKRGEWRGVGMW